MDRPQQMDQERHKIVIVDDDRGVRTALERLLWASGYRVESFASADELLRAGGLSAARCLIIDVQLGAESGLELARHAVVRKLRLPVIFITASDERAVRAEAEACGCAAYLCKPFRAEELLAAVADALENFPPSL